MRIADYHGIDRTTIVMGMTGKNENPMVEGAEPVQGAFVPYSFRRWNESSRPTRPPTANSSSNRKNLLTKVNCLGLRGSEERGAKIGGEPRCWCPGRWPSNGSPNICTINSKLLPARRRRSPTKGVCYTRNRSGPRCPAPVIIATDQQPVDSRGEIGGAD